MGSLVELMSIIFCLLHLQGYASGKKLVYAMSPDRQSMDLSYPELAFAGAFSALPQTAITCPVERVKVILQSQGEQRLYSGPADVVKKLYAEGGVAALYRGTFATLFRDMPGSAACVGPIGEEAVSL